MHRRRDVPRGLSDLRVEVVPRKPSLSEPANGSTLPTMVGAVIYVRVSTKEQTENLSLPTQLRACEEYCRRPGLRDPRTLPRGRRERQVHRPQSASEPAHILPAEQGPRALRGRVQSDPLCARQVRPLRAALAPAVAWHLPAVGYGADRRHLHGQADGGRACRIGSVR